MGSRLASDGNCADCQRYMFGMPHECWGPDQKALCQIKHERRERHAAQQGYMLWPVLGIDRRGLPVLRLSMLVD